ncbi:MAG: ABC transporter permease, partial [Solirubrobacteraceae bacterium]
MQATIVDGCAYNYNRRSCARFPEKLLDVTLQPVVFVLLFAYVFGGMIAVPDGSYREYLVAGVLVQTLAFGLMGPGVAIATDLKEGFVDRFRALPTSRWAYLLGHLLAELRAMLVALSVLTATGLVVGWTIHTDVLHAAAGFGLLLLFGSAMIT